MERKAREILASNRRDRLVASINKAIGEICKEDKYEITYAEINSALIRVLNSNNIHELNTLYKEDK